MPIVKFPDPRHTGAEGLVAIGGDLHPDSLMTAYRSGIFPWPVGDYPLVWFCPPERGVLWFKHVHIPRRLARARRRSPLRLTIDADFPQVIRTCAEVHGNGPERGTWILPAIIDAYVELHRRGRAHSVEVWDGRRLVGGVYGVDVDGAFAAESMFHLVDDASKLALLHLIEHLTQRCLDWLDIQVLTPHMERLGATTLPRGQFLSLLAETRARRLVLFPKTRTSD